MKTKKLFLAFIVTGILLSLGLAGLGNPSSSRVADEVISITKAQWAAEMRHDVAGAMKNVADDYTEFNPSYATRIDGKAMNARLAKANAGADANTVAAEMANEKVQVYGNVAVLSYNYVGATKDKDGQVDPVRAKSTRVYVKQGGRWMLVHANFGADPVNTP